MKSLSLLTSTFIFFQFSIQCFSQDGKKVAFYSNIRFSESTGTGMVRIKSWDYNFANKYNLLHLSWINGFRIGKYQGGLGFGIEKWESDYIYPVFLSSYLRFNDRKWSPAAMLDLGFTAGHRAINKINRREQGAGNSSISAGMSVKSKGKPEYYFLISYSRRSMDALGSKSLYAIHHYGTTYRLVYQFIGLSVGTKI